MASEASLVFGVMGWFLVVGTLLGLSGIAGSTVAIPGDVSSQEGQTDQSFTGAVVECVFTFFQDCSQKTQTRTFTAITDVLLFAASYLWFFFQLLTYQLPIPGWLNSIIVLPPAAMMVYVGIRFARGGG